MKLTFRPEAAAPQEIWTWGGNTMKGLSSGDRECGRNRDDMIFFYSSNNGGISISGGSDASVSNHQPHITALHFFFFPLPTTDMQMCHVELWALEQIARPPQATSERLEREQSQKVWCDYLVQSLFKIPQCGLNLHRPEIHVRTKRAGRTHICLACKVEV